MGAFGCHGERDLPSFRNGLRTHWQLFLMLPPVPCSSGWDILAPWVWHQRGDIIAQCSASMSASPRHKSLLVISDLRLGYHQGVWAWLASTMFFTLSPPAFVCSTQHPFMGLSSHTELRQSLSPEEPRTVERGREQKKNESIWTQATCINMDKFLKI